MNNYMVTRTMRDVALLALLLVSLSACVTTTTGGFAVEPSEEQAVRDYIQLATGYFDAGDMAGARRHINNAMELDSRNSDIYNIQALVFQAEGDLDLAEENFRRAISLDRDNSRARNNYAALLFAANRYDEAYEQLEQVTQDVNYDGRAIAFENLGRAALRLDQEEDAKTAFQRALQLNSNLYLSALELSIIESNALNWQIARRYFQQYMTTVNFYNIPHTPRALLAGIKIEGQFQNEQLVEGFVAILSTLYQDSPEYLMFQRLSNAN